MGHIARGKDRRWGKEQGTVKDNDRRVYVSIRVNSKGGDLMAGNMWISYQGRIGDNCWISLLPLGHQSSGGLDVAMRSNKSEE